MKRLTIKQVAGANIRVNRKAYLSLLGGILMAVFLATATSLCVWGTLRGHEEQMAERLGWMDMFLMGNSHVTDEQLRSTGFFREIGHVTVNAVAEERSICSGWYDETAEKLMNRTLAAGRMPIKAGETAIERSALMRLGHEGTSVGDTLTLNMYPIHGAPEEKSYTVVGILNEQTDYLRTFQDEEGMRFPAMLVSPQDTCQTGGTLVHRVMTYVPLMTLNQVHRHAPEYISGGLYDAIGVSREDGEVVFSDSGWERARKTANRILIWAILGAALMLSACIGITSAMESLLSRKTEDIGMLRAIGATRDQIRRVYGAEAWLLAATALPAGLLLGILAAWLVSLAAPDQVAFSLNIWLLIPILGMSALCVFVASRLPLYHASSQMPMGVLRDSTLLRRAGKTRNHSLFKPDSLIAGRRIRLHPLRQAGAACMVALTLISTLMLGELAMGLYDREEKEQPDFVLYGMESPATDEAFSQLIQPDDMTRYDLRRIASVQGVSRIDSITELNANLVMKEVPEYFRPRSYSFSYEDGSVGFSTFSTLQGMTGNPDWLFYSEKDLEDAAARRGESMEAEMAVYQIAQRNLVRAKAGTTEHIVPVHIYVADPDPAALQEFVTDGAIDRERLDSGEQVLVYAPTICGARREQGGYVIENWLYPRQVREGKWDVVIENDYFTAGMPLKILELAGDAVKAGMFSTEKWPDWKAYYQSLETVRADVSVGAVLTGPVRFKGYYMSGFTVIMTSKGAEALGLKLPGPSNVNIYLSGSPSPAKEADIENQIRQIAMQDWIQLENRLEINREYMTKKYRQMLLFTALILVFAAVSVSMQVSSATRQIRAETRTIGTLRAVGADLRTLVGCYRLPVWISAGAALIPCLLMYAVQDIPALRLFRDYHPQVVIPALAALAACVALICTAGIRRRLAGVTRQSIVDNIREL